MPHSNMTEEKAILRRKILGVKICQARARAGLNLKEVSQVLDLSADAVADVEYGRTDISLPQLEVLALIFGVPVSYFWAEDVISGPDLKFPVSQAMALRRRIIGVLLHQARSEASYTQEELGDILGVSAQTIASYEFGETDIPVLQLETLSRFLMKPITYFIDEGIRANGNGSVNSLDDIANYSKLPADIKEFISNPANVLYINIAMKLSELSAETLRALAEGMLEVTY